MTNYKQVLEDMHRHLGHRSLNRTWAKLEILFGLGAAGIGLLLGQRVWVTPAADVEWTAAAGSLALFVLGGYLALAGHRSHLYQSSNELTAYLVEELRRLKDKVEST